MFLGEAVPALVSAIFALAVALFSHPQDEVAMPVMIMLGVFVLAVVVPTLANFPTEVRRVLMALRHIAHGGSAPLPPIVCE